MNQTDVTRGKRFQSLSVYSKRGLSIVSVIVVIGVIAIAVGLLLPKIAPKRKTPAPIDEVGPSRIDSGRCVSDFFGFSIAVPKGWWYVQEEGIEKYVERKGDAYQEKTAPILLCTKERPQQGVRPTAMLAVFAQRLSKLPDVHDAETYLHNVILRDGRSFYGKPQGPYRWAHAGQTFFRVDGLRQSGDKIASSAYIAIVKKGYALGMGGFWENDEDGRILEEAFKSARFE